MGYTLNIDTAALRLFKKLPPEVQEELIHKAQILKDAPFKGELLRGKYRLLRSLHLSIKGTSYRIIYQVFSQAETVVIRLAGTRENIYRRLDEMRMK